MIFTFHEGFLVGGVPLRKTVTCCQRLSVLSISKVEGCDFGGMFCAVMKVKSLIVSAGIIRIFREEMAELPLVATSIESQGQGYGQMLVSCLENLLLSLNVKKLVLPAAIEAESLWTNKFGFRKIKNEELMNYHKDYQIMVFQRTTMLQKFIGSS